MKKTVPFKKQIEFKTNVAEIISISLDHKMILEERVVRGNLLVSGSYKMNDISINTEEFNYNIPVNIEVGEKYVLDNLKIDIEDFYYELIDNKILSVDIEIGLDNLEIMEKKEVEEVREVEPVKKIEVKTLFDNFDESLDTYATYKICIVKEEETIETILTKYEITKELLEKYNDLTDIKIGDKIIIPTNEEN